MPDPSVSATGATPARLHPLFFIGALFFIFGFVTWLSSVLIPYLQIACELTSFQSYLVSFAFFISYFIMATPSAWLLKITGYKKGMSAGLLLVAAGSLLFVPAAIYRQYLVFLTGLFVQGAGLAVLQTASNPYVTILGPVESAARRMSIMGICNGIAGIVAPLILGAVILNDVDSLTAELQNMSIAQKTAALNALAEKVIMPYIVITTLLVILSVLIYRSPLPEISPEEEETAKPEGGSVFHFPYLLLGVFTLFLYVGVEVIAGNTIISYGAYQGIKMSTARFFTSFTLLAMLAGYLAGIVLIPRYLSQQAALKYSALLGILFSLAAIFTSGYTSVLFIALLGLANSLMYPAIWPLSIHGLGRFTNTGASLLVMAISGGAMLPLIYGRLADQLNEQQAYWMVIPCYMVIGFFAVKGHLIGRKK
ncbi:sugar MFS transporter [Chitinophaga cymbidii]|uniref:Glucose/galactose MFS transporter n=1 Tax=Chitinophaga cymbidii TaxID=1096750 RepID=A0A512REY1_9BACT|nr:sugar MFS transporter [Chitinophaga cymbidii]GEP94269.1 glucose/galactose MFS transporter [Chitinophaga cymbidii]